MGDNATALITQPLPVLPPIAKRKGRPPGYSLDITARICAGIAAGKSIRTICAEDGMPSPDTVFRWLAGLDGADGATFSEQYARAVHHRATARFEQSDQVMADMRAGLIDAQQARVMIDTIKWQCGKESPKRYGDKLELAGDAANPLQLVVRRADQP